MRHRKTSRLRCATHDWILSLDADEQLTPELAAEILALKKSGPRFDGYSFPRLAQYLGRWIRHSGWYPDRKIRLYNRAQGRMGRRLRARERAGERAGRRTAGHLLHFTCNSLSGPSAHARSLHHARGAGVGGAQEAGSLRAACARSRAGRFSALTCCSAVFSTVRRGSPSRGWPRFTRFSNTPKRRIGDRRCESSISIAAARCGAANGRCCACTGDSSTPVMTRSCSPAKVRLCSNAAARCRRCPASRFALGTRFVARRFDLVHAHDARSHTFAALFFARAARGFAPRGFSRSRFRAIALEIPAGRTFSRRLASCRRSIAQRGRGRKPHRGGLRRRFGARRACATGDAILVPDTLDPQKGMALAQEAARAGRREASRSPTTSSTISRAPARWCISRARKDSARASCSPWRTA